MEILQLISSSGFYGAEGVVCLLSEQLTRIRVPTSIAIFNADAPENARLLTAATERGIDTHDVPCPNRLSALTVWRLRKLVRQFGIEVIHTHGYKANLYGLIAACITGCSVVATCHNWTGRTAMIRVYERLDRAYLRYFDHVVAVSTGVAERLEASGVKKSRLRVIPNGVARGRTDRAARTENTVLRIGVVSRLSIEKGVDVLVRALPLILSEFPEVEIVIAGEGAQRVAIEALAEQLGVSGSVRLPGYCGDVSEFLASCDVVVHPSRVDAMPLAVLEAMSAAKPIVASIVGEIPELLDHGTAGRLVEPDQPDLLAEAILQLLRNPSLRERLGREAYRRSGKYGVEAMANRYREVYQSLRLRPIARNGNGRLAW